MAVLPLFRNIGGSELGNSKLNSIPFIIPGKGNIGSNSSYSGSNNSTLFITLLSASFLLSSSISLASTFNSPNLEIFDIEPERPTTFHLLIHLVTSLLYLRILIIINSNYRAK